MNGKTLGSDEKSTDEYRFTQELMYHMIVSVLCSFIERHKHCDIKHCEDEYEML